MITSIGFLVTFFTSVAATTAIKKKREKEKKELDFKNQKLLSETANPHYITDL